ncbi:MAG: non-canonical purine NTP pyrophosphatase [Candidatus Woesearchaeota archaeon]
MKDLYFITGNQNKFKEVSALLSVAIEQLAIDLPEIQELDATKIIEAKLLEAAKHHSGSFIVEDTSLYCDCLGNLPGPLIKWFLGELGRKGLYDLVSKYGQFGATAKTVIGLYDKGTITYFEGETKGTLVKPEDASSFGWDPLFKPEGSDKTYAAMSLDEKNKVSHRMKAVKKLQEYVKK